MYYIIIIFLATYNMYRFYNGKEGSGMVIIIVHVHAAS